MTHCRCEVALALADAAFDATLSEGDGLIAAVALLKDALQTFGMTFAGPGHCCPLGIDGKIGTNGRPGDRIGAEACRSRFAEALAIIRPGACNLPGVALAITDACRQVQIEGGVPVQDPAVRLMAGHLAWLCQSDDGAETHAELIADCHRRAAEESSHGPQ